jgi:ubiquinone/menaquinone biosynthesis C-methylase UbiE
MASDDTTVDNEEKRAIADFYSRVVTSYDRVGPAVFARFGEGVVAVAGIPVGARVLDVGAGRGASLFPAAAAVGASGRVEGIDIAPAMVAETSQAIAAAGIANAGMQRMDGEHLAFADSSFDYVLCSFTYFFFSHLDRAFGQFYRVLSPGGMLLLTTRGAADERWSWYERNLVLTYQAHGLPLPALGGVGHRDRGELRELLARAGFADLREAPLEVEAVYADAEEWWAAKWTHGARRLLEMMPPELLRSFVAEVNERLPTMRQDDGFHEWWRIVCLLGTRSQP